MTASLFSIAGRIAVVTGGLGQLGREYTRSLVSAGARVAVIDVTDDAARLRSAFGQLVDDGLVALFKADITVRRQLEEALAAITDSWGVPHVLVNNAALDSPPDASAAENGPFETYPEASWDRVMEVNVKGTMLCCQVFGGAMAQQGRGSIINIASIYGTVSPDQTIYEYRRRRGELFFKPVAYSASKSAIYNLTRYLATYWGAKGVRVNTLTLAGVFNNQDEEFLREYTRRMPIGRMARSDEYGGAVVFLASDASSYMTGSTLTLDGGWTAW
jgi:NAD(P)-dependent dehydrogenase (short-subunit alcohol dehydrogenase family)